MVCDIVWFWFVLTTIHLTHPRLSPYSLLSAHEQKDGSAISPWHDIPLKADANTFNFITEIPKL